MVDTLARTHAHTRHSSLPSELNTVDKPTINTTVPTDLAFSESVDAVPESEQGAIDVGALTESRTAICRNRGSLRAGEVDKRELSHTEIC